MWLELFLLVVSIFLTSVERERKNYPQFNFFVSSATDVGLLSLGIFNCIALVGTLWHVMYNLDQVFDNVRKMLKPSGIFVINQTFIPDQQYGNDLFEDLHGFLGLLSKNRFLNVLKIVPSRICHKGKFIMDH